MANIKINITGKPYTGRRVTFPAPCGCDQVTDGLVINGETYTVCDAMGECVTGKGGAWCAGAQISVVLDCENKKAFIQNAASPNLKDALNAHIDNQNNPHNVTAEQIGAISYDAYVWKEFEPEKPECLIGTSAVEETMTMGSVTYSSEIVSDGTTVTLVNPTTVSLSSISSDLSILVGKFYTTTQGATGKVKYIHPSDKAPTYGFVYQSGNVYTFNYRTVTPYMTAKVLLGNVVSSDSNAYPHGGEQNGLYYEFCGNLLDYVLSHSTIIQTGSYGGTSTYGEDNPNRLTFDFVPKFFMAVKYSASTNPALVWMGNRGGDQGAGNYNSPAFTLDGTTLSWYSQGSAAAQCNDSTYYWIAIG